MCAGLLLVDAACASRRRRTSSRIFGHDLGVLLPHRLAQHVGLAEREAGEHVRDAHHLFLIRDDAVGLGENRLELRQLVLDLGLALLARDEVVHHAAAQRARPVQRVQRDEVLEPLRLGLAQDVAHAAALELEDAVGLPVLEDLIGLRHRRAGRGRCRAVSPVVRSISAIASSISVSVLSPRKSIFSRPMRSISFIDHWVVISSRAPL